jgi:HSP20 family protein
MNTCTTSACAPATTHSASAAEHLVKPRYDVRSSKDAYEVRVELPGVRKGDVKLDFERGLLTLTAQRQSTAQEGWQTLHRELNRLNYGLQLRVNAPVDERAFVAKLEDGVLTVTLPVKEAAKPRTIEIA